MDWSEVCCVQLKSSINWWHFASIKKCFFKAGNWFEQVGWLVQVLPLLYQIAVGRYLQADGCCLYLYLILRDLGFLEFGWQLSLGTQCLQYLFCHQLEGLWELCSFPVTNRTAVFLDFNVWRALKVSIPSLWRGPGCAQHRTLWALLEVQDQQHPSPAGPGRTDGTRNHTSKVGGCWNPNQCSDTWNLYYQSLLGKGPKCKSEEGGFPAVLGKKALLAPSVVWHTAADLAWL